ncbi:GGDEF domain-containing protein [Pleionea sp. CnH1-48]|uniref:GGDEF domain-containing protein n=1 Tax=Pleionea sp. CnH1-48 TaxID=2954494 RepID=UPI002096D379|nr:diguanylate cyclase [Pleionea sp. CnH1-48]MCO7227180.1 diguanylate cyclase [Pleionea sp. CnH1-48]
MNEDSNSFEIKEMHWVMDMLHTVDVGILVLDSSYTIRMWNAFMENHSGKTDREAIGSNVFSVFPEVPQAWFKHKIDSVFLLKNRAFSVWEQRPYLFKFKSYRPITGTESFMYQNATIIPLMSADGQANHVCVLIYDVTDTASNKKDLTMANQKLENLSRTDALTQLYNRGYWEECFYKEFRRCRRYDSDCSLVIFDIDHFKQVNDTHGHQAGDAVIRSVSQTVKGLLRDSDIFGRYGGEEFVVFLPNTNSNKAKMLAERIRHAVEELVITHEGTDIRFTISLGVAQLTDAYEKPDQWIAAADDALYASKENGRNLITIAKEI